MSQSEFKQGLTKRSFNSAAWTIVGFGLSQLIRLANSLLLTRFLAPEHFGIVSIVTSYLIGLAMFSDMGIGTSIIQSNRADDKRFLNTAWTIQVMRGLMLWGFCLLTAWPVAEFYNEPQLLWIIPVSGLTAVIAGFGSTAVFTRNRELNIKRVVMNEVCGQLSSLVLMLCLAMIYPSVWVLVVGSLWASLFSLVMSHRLDKSIRNGFFWDKESAHALIHFGKWVFLSSICGFFVNSGSTLILGKLMPMANLGLFSIGLTLAKVVEQVFNQINNRVVMPLYVKIKDLPNAELRKRIIKLRLAIMAAFLPPLWVMVTFAEEITMLLFDERYQGAAWILQVFALSYIPLIVAGLGGFYYALGDSFKGLQVSFVKMVFYFVSLYLGWKLNGNMGVIAGIAFSNIIHYIMDTSVQRKYKIWISSLDILGLGLSLFFIQLIFLLK